MTIYRCRTWPVPDEVAHRPGPFVHDRLPKVYTSQYDYTPLVERAAQSDAEGVLAFDWDIAVSREDLMLMSARALSNPERGFVAPYRLYPSGKWAHRRITFDHADAEQKYLPVLDHAPDCDLPGFGAIYLPAHLLAAWEPASHDPRLTDQNFGLWAWNKGIRWPIEWDVHVIHVHY